MTLRVGIAGLGTVGCGLLSIAQTDYRPHALSELFRVTAVSARTRDRNRPVPIDGYKWFDDPVALATDPETDIFVELIGGSEGPAREAATAALKAGKHVATANKALIAAHAKELAQLAEDNGVALRFEAAVAGGTPVVRGLADGAGPCRIESLAGILNGTCNFVLDQMSAHGANYDDAVREAQEVGFAEADPSLDVDGFDAAHKLAILAMIGFDALVSEKDLRVRGISGVTPRDIEAAKHLHQTVKLVAEARRLEGKVALRVTPAFVPDDHPFAAAEGPGNAVTVAAEPVGTLMFTGPGAGAGATAAAVAADLTAIARGNAKGPVFSVPASDLAALDVASPDGLEDSYALILPTDDIAAAKSVLKTQGVALSRIERVEDVGVVAVTAFMTAERVDDVLAAAEGLGSARPTAFPLLTP